ncbi:MAG: porin family protein [Elusimicrobia bacterium]|nr:porin family protein [Elusimicrobiota bacterium]
MNTKILAAALALVALAPFAAADDGAVGPQPGISIGGRAMYFKPRDAQDGTLSGGAQLRLHVTSVLALEGSVDYRQDKFGGQTTDVFPVQASLLVYLMPGFRISPYLLGGGGWYFTHVQGANNPSPNRFGPHAGAGLEFFMNSHWSVDGSYRYVWNEDIHSQNAAHPLGQNFSDSGSMLTAALNYRF